jgi:predicted DNA-binding transcriptional regulator AlpA
MSRRAFDRYMRSPGSPQPIHLSRRLVLFKRAELDAFFSNKQSGGSTVMEATNAE